MAKKKVVQKDLIKVAVEFNKLFYEEPDTIAITEDEFDALEDQKTEVFHDYLMEQIKEGAEDITLEDKFSDEVIGILRKLGMWIEQEEKKEDDEDEDKNDDGGEEGEEGINLEEEIEDAEDLSDLKAIAKANDEFKSIRGSLTKYKKVKDLRKFMLDVLENGPPKEKKEEKKEEKKAEKPKEEKKPAKKAEPKKTRIDVAVEVLLEFEGDKPDLERLYEEADKAYQKLGNKENLQESKWSIKTVLSVFFALGKAEKTEDSKVVKINK